MDACGLAGAYKLKLYEFLFVNLGGVEVTLSGRQSFSERSALKV